MVLPKCRSPIHSTITALFLMWKCEDQWRQIWYLDIELASDKVKPNDNEAIAGMVLMCVVLNHRVLTSKIPCVYVLINLPVFNSLLIIFFHFFTVESWQPPKDDSALLVLRRQGGGSRALLVFPWILGPLYSRVLLHFYASFPIKDFEQSRRVPDFIFFISTA